MVEKEGVVDRGVVGDSGGGGRARYVMTAQETKKKGGER